MTTQQTTPATKTALHAHQAQRRCDVQMENFENPLDSGNIDYVDDFDVPPKWRVRDADNKKRLRDYVLLLTKALREANHGCY